MTGPGLPPDASGELVQAVAREASDRMALWSSLADRIQARTVAEIGVYRGAFAAQLLAGSPMIEIYYMIDPWRHLTDWNKPANRQDDAFEQFYAEAMHVTREHERRRVVLRGRTVEVIDRIPDRSLDLAYVDGDHTLRGITVDLIRVYDKVRDGGWIGGDDFTPSIWQHGATYEPTLVFPFAVHFAEAVGARIYALPFRQFLIEKRDADAFAFVDLTGRYTRLDLLGLLGPSAVGRGPARPPRLRSRARKLLRRARDRVTR